MISVIVPAYDEEETIKACIESIKSQLFEDYEIIVVAGGEDKTFEIASTQCKTIRDKKNKGAGPARNQGAKIAKGEILAFTDADTKVNSRWLEFFAETFENKKVVGAGGPVRTINGNWLDKIIFKITQDWCYKLTSLFGFYQFSGQNCAYRKKQFLDSGGFNEEMSMLEDTELSNRIKKFGKTKYISKNWVKSSPRRMHKKGYFNLFMKFVRGYYSLYILKKPPKEAYFASASENKN